MTSVIKGIFDQALIDIATTSIINVYFGDVSKDTSGLYAEVFPTDRAYTIEISSTMDTPQGFVVGIIGHDWDAVSEAVEEVQKLWIADNSLASVMAGLGAINIVPMTATMAFPHANEEKTEYVASIEFMFLIRVTY